MVSLPSFLRTFLPREKFMPARCSTNLILFQLESNADLAMTWDSWSSKLNFCSGNNDEVIYVSVLVEFPLRPNRDQDVAFGTWCSYVPFAVPLMVLKQLLCDH